MKLETFYHFKCFKRLVEKKIGTPIKCLRTDRGGELNSAELNCNDPGKKEKKYIINK